MDKISLFEGVFFQKISKYPLTYLDKHNPEQFEILGITENNKTLAPYWISGAIKYDRPYIKGKRMYPRLLIRNKHPQQL